MVFEKIPVHKDQFQEAKDKGLTLSELLAKHENYNRESKIPVLFQQLAARNLTLSGGNVSLVGDFFQTEENKILFVETINEAVRIGLLEENEKFATLKELIATSTGIKGITYDSAEVDIEKSTRGASRVSEKAKFPKVTIDFKDKSIKLFKFGFAIEATYETIRRMKINVFNVSMKVIGRNIARQKVSHALDVLVNGDGNGNPIASINAATSGTLTYADIINLQEEFEYYTPSLMISDKDSRVKYLNLAEYKDKQGPSMPKPPKRVVGFPANKIIALDAKSALEEVYEKGGSLVEYDKVINQQIETAVVSDVSGYAKLFPDAAKMLNVSFT